MALLVKNLPASAEDVRDEGSVPGSVEKIPWRRTWQPTPVFLPRAFPRTEEPGGYSPQGGKESRCSLSALEQHSSLPKMLFPRRSVQSIG